MTETAPAMDRVPDPLGHRAGLQRADHGGRDHPPDARRRAAPLEVDVDRRRRRLDATGPTRSSAAIEDSTVRVITHQVNQGKGAAIRTGLAARPGDLVLDPGRRPRVRPRRLAPPAGPRSCKGQAHVVYGSRFTGERKNMLPLHWVGNRLLSLVTNVLYSSRSRTWRPATSSSTAGCSRASPSSRTASTSSPRSRPRCSAGATGSTRCPSPSRARARRGQEDHLARRLRGAGGADPVPLHAGTTDVSGRGRPGRRRRGRLRRRPRPSPGCVARCWPRAWRPGGGGGERRRGGSRRRRSTRLAGDAPGHRRAARSQPRLRGRRQPRRRRARGTTRPTCSSATPTSSSTPARSARLRRRPRRRPGLGHRRAAVLDPRRRDLPLGAPVPLARRRRRPRPARRCCRPDNPFTRRYRPAAPGGRRRAGPTGSRAPASWPGAGPSRSSAASTSRYFMFAEDMDLCWRAHRPGWGVGLRPGAGRHPRRGRLAPAHPYRMLVAHHRSALRFAGADHRGWRRALLPWPPRCSGLRLVLAWPSAPAAEPAVGPGPTRLPGAARGSVVASRCQSQAKRPT